MSPERAAELFRAIEILREIRKDVALVAPELAIAFPAAAGVTSAVVATEPALEAALSLVFEFVSVAQSTTDPEAQRAAIRDAIARQVQAALTEKFG